MANVGVGGGFYEFSMCNLEYSCISNKCLVSHVDVILIVYSNQHGQRGQVAKPISCCLARTCHRMHIPLCSVRLSILGLEKKFDDVKIKQ